MTIKTCFYSGEPFKPKCPITECPAHLATHKSGCAFLEVGSDKNKLSKNDMSLLFGVSPATANKKFSFGKEEVRDMAKLAMALTENVMPTTDLIILEGVFFSNFVIPVSRKSLKEAVKVNSEVRAILKRRMIKVQYKTIFKGKRKAKK